MQTSKVLININNLSELNEYEKVGIANFLFPIKDLSIGYTSFDIDEVPDQSYLLINRVLDTEGINLFKSLIPKLDRFKGIVFEDLGIFNMLKDSNLELIWNQAHFAVNYNSINYYLDNGCESAIISNEITKEEIEEIINKANKPVILNIMGKNMIMYSRRSLVSNFNNHANIENINDVDIKDKTDKAYFTLREDKYGTAVFNKEYFNYINKLNIDDNKIKYYLITNIDLEPNKIIDIINGESFGNDGFLYKKTTYKMSEYDDRKKVE